MTSRCITCKHIDLQADKRLSKTGFAPCKAKALSAYSRPFMRERYCSLYAMTDDATVATRLNWAKSIGQ